MCNNNCNDNKLENEIYALALSVSKILQCNFTIAQLAVIAAFLQALLSNMSVHIQAVNYLRSAGVLAQELSGGALAQIGADEELE